MLFVVLLCGHDFVPLNIVMYHKMDGKMDGRIDWRKNFEKIEKLDTGTSFALYIEGDLCCTNCLGMHLYSNIGHDLAP